MNIEKASKTDNNNELFPIKESKSEDPKETVQDATDCATRLLNQFTNDTKSATHVATAQMVSLASAQGPTIRFAEGGI
eukprot:gene10491-11591_t